METQILAKQRFELISWALDERLRRLLAASEAKVIGRGGVSQISKITGISRVTIHAGLKELDARDAESTEDLPVGKTRRQGGGRKKVTETSPEILKLLKDIVEPSTRGDPESPLLWTAKSLRTLASELAMLGYKISHETIGSLLEKIGYSLQANSKVLEGSKNPDRNQQFEFINNNAQEVQLSNNPVISVDTKKKELQGNLIINNF